MIQYAGKSWRIMLQYRNGGHRKFEISIEEMISRTERRGLYRIGEASELLRVTKEIRTPGEVITLEEIKDKPAPRHKRIKTASGTDPTQPKDMDAQLHF